MLDLTPLLVKSSQYNGDWRRYYDALYEYFCQDFIEDSPFFGKCEVTITGTAIEDGKEKTFWHIVTTRVKLKRYTNQSEQDRIPDYKRAERIRWIKEIIENYEDPSIRTFKEVEPNRHIYYLWYKDEFIVILGRGLNYAKFYLVTAFYVNEWDKKRYEKKYKELCIKKEDIAVATSYPFKP